MLWWWIPRDQITKAHTNTCIVVGDTTPNSYWMGWMEVSSSSSATALQCIPALLVLSKKAFSHNYFVFYVLLLHHLHGWYTHPMYTMIFSFGRKLEFAMSNIFIRKFGNLINTKAEFGKLIHHALWPMIWQC